MNQNFIMPNNFNYQNNNFNDMNQINLMNMLMNMQFNQLNMLNNQINYMNELNIMNNQMKEANNCEIINEYPEIKGEKKTIILIRNDNSKKVINIPKYLSKSELYLIANKYKINTYSTICLYYNNSLLKNDDSNIDDISNGNEIYMIEELLENTSYYKNYLQKHKNEELKSIIFDCSSTPVNKKLIKQFSPNTKIKEMIKIVLYEMQIPEANKNEFSFSFNAKTLDNNDNLTLYEKGLMNNSIIIVFQRIISNNENIKGIKLLVNVKFKNNIILSVYIGTLNTIKDLYILLQNNLLDKNIIIKNLKINKQKYEVDDERTFSSLGIRGDFTCKINEQNLNHDTCCNIF